MERTIPDRKPPQSKATASAEGGEAPRAFPDEELRILRLTKTNALLLGPSVATEAALDLLTADRAERVWFWTPAQSIRVSERAIVVIRDVGVLTPYVQAGWLAALERLPRARAQVISTNTFSVFPLVARGLFLDALYYRLNCVLVDLRRGGNA